MKKFGDIKVKKKEPIPTTETQSKSIPLVHEDVAAPVKLVKKAIPKPKELNPLKTERQNKKSYGFIFVIFFFAITVFFLMNYFGTIDVYITPLEKEVSINESTTLSRDETIPGVRYEIMSVSDSVVYSSPDADTDATTPTTVSGTIRIFNTYSKNKIILEKGQIVTPTSNTQIQFVLDDTATVPGYIQKGKDIIPGSVDVHITSVKKEVSVAKIPQDFTLDKKDPKIYARSLGALVLDNTSDALLVKKNTEEEAKLRTALFSLVTKEMPKGYTAIDTLTTYEGTTETGIPIQKNTSESKTQIKQTGKLSVVIIENKVLDDFLLEHGEFSKVFKDGNMSSLILDKKITFKGSGDMLVNNKTGDVSITSSFTVKKNIDILSACEAVKILPLDGLVSLSPDNQIFFGRVGEVSVHKFPPWILSKPSMNRIKCAISS